LRAVLAEQVELPSTQSKETPLDAASPWTIALAESDMNDSTRARVIEVLASAELTPEHVQWLDQVTAETVLEKAGILRLGLRIEIMKVAGALCTKGYQKPKNNQTAL
jgi:hypothetical protein